MTAKEMLVELRDRDFILMVAGNDLNLRCLPGALTTELKDQIRAMKRELIEVLKAEDIDASKKGHTRRPYIDYRRKPPEVIIPIMDSHPRYRHWQGGQSLLATLIELNAPMEVIRPHIEPWYWERIRPLLFGNSNQ